MKLAKTINLKTYLITILAISILFGSVTYIFAQSNGTFTIGPGVYPGAPSYTIWKEDSTYYAKNSYGIIQSGTNLSSIIQSAINSLTNGGKIFFRNGDYYFKYTITIPNSLRGLHIQGEDENTRFIMSPNYGASDNDSMFETGTDVNNLILCDFRVYMTHNETFFSATKGLGRAWFSRLWIANEAGNYIGTIFYIKLLSGYANYELFFSDCSINYGGYLIYIYAASEVFLRNCKFGGYTSTARSKVFIQGTGYPSIVGCGFENVQVQLMAVHHFIVSENWWSAAPDRAIYIYNAANGTVSDNIINDVARYDQTNNVGIYLYGYDEKDILICGNKVSVSSDPAYSYGIWEGAGNADYNIILNNDCRHCPHIGIFVNGANTKVNLCYNGSTWIE